MRNILLLLIIITAFAGTASADINSYISDLNVSASMNIGEFKTQIRARFGTSAPKLDLVLSSVNSPAEGAVVLWMKEKSNKPLDVVLSVYKNQKKRGWGAMARELGIKPGSSEFHALKQGNIGFKMGTTGDIKVKSKNKDKAKGKNRK